MSRTDKPTRLIGVPGCPAENLQEVLAVYEYYAEKDTITHSPAIYKVAGKIPKEKVLDFYKAIEKINKRVEGEKNFC